MRKYLQHHVYGKVDLPQVDCGMSGERAVSERTLRSLTAKVKRSTFPTFALFYVLNAECNEGVKLDRSLRYY